MTSRIFDRATLDLRHVVGAASNPLPGSDRVVEEQNEFFVACGIRMARIDMPAVAVNNMLELIGGTPRWAARLWVVNGAVAAMVSCAPPCMHRAWRIVRRQPARGRARDTPPLKAPPHSILR